MQSLVSNKFISLILSIFSSLLIILSFPKFDLWFLAYVGLLPLFFAIKGKRPFSSFFLSYLAGILFFSGIIYWLVHVTLLGYILLVFYLAIYFGLFGFCVSFFSEKSPFFKLLIFPSIWVALEFLRGHLLTGFGWAFLGYSQYKALPVIQIADITGVYGVSFIIVMVNVAIWLLISDFRSQKSEVRKSMFCFLFSVFCFLFVISYGFYRIIPDSNSKKIKISVIQGNIPQAIKWENNSLSFILEKHLQLSKLANADNPDLIIWPETSFPGFFGKDKYLLENLISSVKKLKNNLLIGAITEEDFSIYNTAILVSSHGVISGIYRKLHLVPFGEYVPLRGIFSFLPQLAVLGDFTPGKEFTVFSLGEDGAKKFSALICFEDTVPKISRQFVKRGANLLVNITNDAWFKDTSAPYQHLQASVFRAVENRTPLVRSANTGVSSFIDSCGRILGKVCDTENRETFIEGYKTREINLRNSTSFYSSFGDVFVLCCLGLFVLAILTPSKKNV